MARTSSIHVYDHFDVYLTPVTLTFNLPYLKKCFKWHFSSSRATTVPNCFEIHALLYQLWSRQIWMDTRMHGCIHIIPNKNCNNYVSLTCKWARQQKMYRFCRKKWHLWAIIYNYTFWDSPEHCYIFNCI